MQFVRLRVIALWFLILVPANAANVEKLSQAERFKWLHRLSQVLYLLETNYVDESKTALPLLVETAVKSVLQSLDPHTSLLSDDAFKQLTIDTKGRFGGIGVIVRKDTEIQTPDLKSKKYTQPKVKLVVIKTVKDAPAELVGIQKDDVIIKVDSLKVETEDDIDTAVDLMKGPVGSKVILRIYRPSIKDYRTFSMTRKDVKIQSVSCLELPGQIHYAKIASFQQNTTPDLHSWLSEHEHKMSGLILDLRDNPGGLLDQAIRVADLFLDSGLIVSTKGRRKDELIERALAHPQPAYLKFPIVILVNEGSASASEIVAGALQELNRAVIMGRQTYGKGSVQTLVPIEGFGGLRMTVALYLTPSGRSIQGTGITPDIVLNPSTPDIETTTLKNLKQVASKAIKEDENQTHSSKWPRYLRDDAEVEYAYSYLTKRIKS